MHGGEYKKYRNQVNNREKNEERLYKTEKISENSDSPEILWKNAKLFMGWKSSGSPHQLLVDNKLVTSAKEIAKLINNFFIDKVQKIRSGMENAPFSLSKVKEIMQNKTCKLRLKLVSVLKVKKILNSLSIVEVQGWMNHLTSL